MAKYIVGDIFKGDYSVSQDYGNNPTYYSQFGLKGHEGVDWATPPGVPILAPFDYKILRDNDDFKNNNYGDYIVVWDPIQKCAVWFCHLSENYVSLGQTGKKGDILGKTGNSGNSTGPHLHVNFVETDAQGNRLNTNNGYQGFLNILDATLVEWKIGGSTMPTQPTLPVELQHYIENWKDIAIQKGLDVNNNMFADYRNIDSIIAKHNAENGAIIKGKQDTIDNLNQQINDRNNDIVQLNAQISTLKSQLLESQTREASLTEQAKQIPSLKEQIDELERQKKSWVERESIYKKTIKDLTTENDALKKNWLKGLLTSILGDIFNKKGGEKK